MNCKHLQMLTLAWTFGVYAQSLPLEPVPDWPQLPAGWNLGETSGVDVDRDDSVWIFHRGERPVMQFDRSGKLLRAWEKLPIQAAHGIRVDPQGNIWTVDVAAHRLVQFDRNGRIRMVIGNAGAQAGTNESKDAFNRPTGLWFLPSGDFYVSDGYANSRVVRFNREGIYQRQWGSKGTGPGQFDLVHDVTVDKQGRVYVADRNNARVQVFDAEGKFLTEWKNAGEPWGLYYLERENALYMCDGRNNRIVKLNLDGQVLGTFSGYGKVPGKLDFAHNIAVDSQGAVYVAEIKNWRVQKFAPKAGPKR